MPFNVAVNVSTPSLARFDTPMDILAENDGKIFARSRIERPENVASPFSGELFPCLIWAHDGLFTAAGRTAVAKGLLEAGCRYAVCGGQNCEEWHDTVDEAFVEAHVDEPESRQDAAFVMTTWHPGETPDDVAFFFVLNTNFDDHDFRRYLVLHVGTGLAEREVDSAVQKYVRGGSAV